MVEQQQQQQQQEQHAGSGDQQGGMTQEQFDAELAKYPVVREQSWQRFPGGRKAGDSEATDRSSSDPGGLASLLGAGSAAAEAVSNSEDSADLTGVFAALRDRLVKQYHGDVVMATRVARKARANHRAWISQMSLEDIEDYCDAQASVCDDGCDCDPSTC